MLSFNAKISWFFPKKSIESWELKNTHLNDLFFYYVLLINYSFMDIFETFLFYKWKNQ